MIYCLADTHFPHDANKLNTTRFPQQDEMTKNDYIIIAGDCGIVWDNSATERYWRRWLNEKSFTTLFIDGNHEHFDLLNAYPVEIWNGGKIHRITDSIIHLMRGQVYDIDGFRVFCFGGAASTDKEFRKEGVSWWAAEIPNENEKSEGVRNLDKVGWNVDFVISHTCPESILEKYAKQKNMWRYTVDYSTEVYLEQIKQRLNFKHWFFGHYHTDDLVDSKFTVLYENVVNIDEYY